MLRARTWAARSGGIAPRPSRRPTCNPTQVADADPTTPDDFIIVSGADLFSFISLFGTNPINGFDDTDRSIRQSIFNRIRFHSGEFNYRRRTVGPYCRFQGSWLAGLRYLRWDNKIGLSMTGLNNDAAFPGLTDGNLRFFNLSNSLENSYLGGQVGGDVWWNMMPGVQLGTEVKAMWLKAQVKNDYRMSSNSIGGGAPGARHFRREFDDGTLGIELQTKFVYRLSHSWSFRSAYYMIAIDEVADPVINRPFILATAASPPQPTNAPTMTIRSLVLNGFSFGTEYIW